MRRISFSPEPPIELGQEKPALVSRGRKSASITLFIFRLRCRFSGFARSSATSQTTLRGVRGLGQLADLKWRTRVGSLPVTGANGVFADASARDFLCSQS